MPINSLVQGGRGTGPPPTDVQAAGRGGRRAGGGVPPRELFTKGGRAHAAVPNPKQGQEARDGDGERPRRRDQAEKRRATSARRPTARGAAASTTVDDVVCGQFAAIHKGVRPLHEYAAQSVWDLNETQS